MYKKTKCESGLCVEITYAKCKDTTEKGMPKFPFLRDENIYGVFNTFNSYLKEQTGVNMSEISSFHFLILLVNVAAKITISNDPISYTHQHGIHEYLSLHVRWNYNSFLFNFHNSICVLSLPRHADVV